MIERGESDLVFDMEAADLPTLPNKYAVVNDVNETLNLTLSRKPEGSMYPAPRPQKDLPLRPSRNQRLQL